MSRRAAEKQPCYIPIQLHFRLQLRSPVRHSVWSFIRSRNLTGATILFWNSASRSSFQLSRFSCRPASSFRLQFTPPLITSIPPHLHTSIPPHLCTSTPPYLRTSAPPYLRTSIPLHLHTSVPPHLRNSGTPELRHSLHSFLRGTNSDSFSGPF